MVKTTDKGMENEVDKADGEVDEMNDSNYEDSAENNEKWQQNRVLQFTKNYFSAKHPDE